MSLPESGVFGLTDITIFSDGAFKASRQLELTIDDRSCNATFQAKATDYKLRWSVEPSILISSTSRILVQPYEARQLVRRRKVTSVTIWGGAIYQACSGTTGERQEYTHRADGFRISLGITFQRDNQIQGISQTDYDDITDPIEDPGAATYGPRPAPNSWKRALNAMVDLKKAIDDGAPNSSGTSTIRELQAAIASMPPYEVDEDIQRLGEQICDILGHLRSPNYTERLHTENTTVSSVIELIFNAATFVRDCYKPISREDTMSMNTMSTDIRENTVAVFIDRLSQLRRNFNKRKNQLVDTEVYRLPRRSAQPSPNLEAPMNEVPDPDSDVETKSITGEEDATLVDQLDPQFTPRHRLNLCCLEGTRRNILEDIISWFDDDDAPNILWLCGGPGTGKTAISWSLIAELERQQRSASEFFLDNHEPSQLWNTLAFKLSKFHPALKTTIYKALKMNPGIAKSISDAYQLLVEAPLRATLPRFDGKSPVFLIDGLDSCSQNSPGWKDMLRTLPKWLDLPPGCKMVITSRPQHEIYETFEGRFVKRIDLPTGNDVRSTDATDIRTYLDHRFTMLKTQDKSLPESWPETHDIEELVKHTAGFFLWAKVAADSIRDAPDIQKQLSSIISSGVATQFDSLDEFFRDIFSSSFGSEPAFTTTMGAVALAKAPLTMNDLPHLFPDRFAANPVQEMCARLLPIVAVSREDQYLTLRHRSFVEYLTDPKRCGGDSSFFVDRSKTSRTFTVACFKLMRDGLKFNICGLKSSHESNADGLKRAKIAIKKFIPSHLLYACKYWAEHLHDIAQTSNPEIVELLEDFLHTRLFFWLEVLSLEGEVGLAPGLLLKAADWLGMSYEELAAFAIDASRFALTFRDPIAYSVPHIYVSAFPLSPAHSPVYNHYKEKFPGILRVVHGDDKNSGWPPLRFAFKTTSYVHALSVHPDGKRVVTAMNDTDGQLQVWSMTTGDPLFRLIGHTSTVRTAVYGPSGKRIATGSDDKTIRIWDAEAGTLLHGPYEIHSDWIRCVSWSSDGTRLASSSDDRTVKVITVETGKPIFEAAPVHTDWVRRVVFHPDGKHVISGSDDRTVRIWDAATGDSVGNPITAHTGYIRAIAISPDGKRIASGGDDNQIVLYDMSTKTQQGKPIKDHSGAIRSLAFSADSKLLVSGSEDKTILVWNAETGERLCDPLQGHTEYVTSVQFSPDMRQIISGGEDSYVRFWDRDGLSVWRPTLEAIRPFQVVTVMTDGKVILASDGSSIWKWWFESSKIDNVAFQSPTGHTIETTAFSPDGTRAATGGSDGMVYIWDTVSGMPVLGPLEGHTEDISSVSFSSDGRRVVSGSDDSTVWVWDAETGERICGPLEGEHNDRVRAVCFNPDGTLVASGARDRSLAVWNVETGEPAHPTMWEHNDWVNAVAYSPDGRYLASGSDDQSLIQDTETGEVIFRPLKGHTRYLRAVAWSPDSKRVASGDSNGVVIVFDVETGAPICGPLHGHRDEISSVTFSADGTQVISASRDGTIRMWAIQPHNFMHLSTFSDHGNWVDSVALSPDGRYVASGGDSRQVFVRDATTGVESIHPLSGHNECVNVVCYSPGGGLIATCSDDGYICLWDINRGRDPAVHYLRGHERSVLSLSFSPDGKRIASGGEDRSLRIWDVEYPAEAKVLRVYTDHRRDVNSVAFSPDGRRIISGCAAGEIIIHDLDAIDMATAEPLLPSYTQRLYGGDGIVLCVAFSPDGKHVVSSGENMPIQIWDVLTGQAVISITKGHTGAVHSVVYTPGGSQIISGGEDGTIRIWDAYSGVALSVPLRGHSKKVLSIAISRDERRLVSGSADHTVAVWELHLERPTLWPESFTRDAHGTEFCTIDEEGLFSDNSTLEDDGWVRSAKSEPLFWIPQMYRTGLWMPQTTAILGAQEIIFDLRRYMHGTAWHRCHAET